MRFQADPIVLHEVAYPPMRIRVRPETQLDLKNTDMDRLHRRNVVWYTGLIDDLKLISIEASTGDEEEDSKLIAEINALILRAEAEMNEVGNLIDEVYRESSPFDTLALNKVRSSRQDKIVAWEMDFEKLPKPRVVQTLDRHGRKVSGFNSIRGVWPKRFDLPGVASNIPSSYVSEAEEATHPAMRRVTADSMVSSSASEMSEPEQEISTRSNVAAPISTQIQETIPEVASTSTVAERVTSDHESDSTIGGAKDGVSPGNENSSVLVEHSFIHLVF